MINLLLVYLYTSRSVPRLSKARVTFGKAGFGMPLLRGGSLSRSPVRRDISRRPAVLPHYTIVFNQLLTVYYIQIELNNMRHLIYMLMKQEVHSFRFPLIRFLIHHTANTIPAMMAMAAITIAAVPKSIFVFSHFVSFRSTG